MRGHRGDGRTRVTDHHPLVEVTGLVEAPVETVTELTLAVRPGPVGLDNAWLLLGIGLPDGTTLTGGPKRFTATGTRDTIEVDPVSRTISLQGGWWYRGEYAFDPARRGTRVTHRVYNIATLGRWAVPLANRFFIGFSEAVEHGFDGALQRIGGRLGCAPLPERRPVTNPREST